MRYFRAVNAIAQAWLLNGCTSWGISPVFGSTPMVSPVKSGMMHDQGHQQYGICAE